MKQCKRLLTTLAAVAGLLLIQASAALSAPILISQGLPSTSYSASSVVTTPTTTADKAFDGSYTTYWQGLNTVRPGFPGWIDVNLGDLYVLDHVDLYAKIQSNLIADATFTVYASTAPILGNVNGATALATYSTTPADLMTTYVAGPPATGWSRTFTFTNTSAFQYLEILFTTDKVTNTTNGYLRPGWEEIQVFGSQPVPEPATLLLVASGIGGLFLLRRRSSK